jgi:hypothetical protein
MAENGFASMIAKERERLSKQREDAIARRKAIESELEGIETELAAVNAYEAAKSGKLPRARNGVRAPRGQRQQQIIELLHRHASGLSRGDIIEKLGAKGNKSEEQGVSNALHVLKKLKKVTAKGGKYTARK